MIGWRNVPRSVTVRVRLVLVAVFGIGALLALLAGWSFARSAADEAYDRLLQSAAVQFFDGASAANGRVTILPPESAFDTLALAEDDRFFYAVREPSGRLLTGYPDLPEAGSSRRQPLSIADMSYLGEAVRVVTLRRPIRTASSEGLLRISVAQTRAARIAMQLKLFERSAPVTLAIAALGLLGSLFAAALAVRPLARLESALEARKPEDLTPLRIDGPRETEALVAAINALVARIGVRVENLQRFAGLAAHQLRTPLAALGSQVDLLANDDDERTRRVRIERLSLRLKELNRLIHQLLGHAMIAYRGDSIPIDVVDLTTLARSVAHDVLSESAIDQRQLVVQVDEAPVTIVGDEMMLREAITNLLNNAATHGAHHLIRIGLAADEQFAIVTVADDGPGIAQDRWSSAAEPFSMKRQNETGAGLGLSIARQIAINHGGDLSFALDADGLFQVAMRLAIMRDG
ncbi:MAG: sensor histidine kinase [Sphingomicrobium sp.]